MCIPRKHVLQDKLQNQVKMHKKEKVQSRKHIFKNAQTREMEESPPTQILDRSTDVEEIQA
jgi:hypothetical protein